MDTPRHALPMLSVAQAHKEVTHNEALILLDFLINPLAQARTSLVPANLGVSDAGKCWIIGNAASGAWTGHEADIACWTGDAWRFISPREGMQIRLVSSNSIEIFINNQWLAPSSVNNAMGGVTIDMEARSALNALLVQLRAFGFVAN
jgi:Protein of unknown function (DUF2793)